MSYCLFKLFIFLFRSRNYKNSFKLRNFSAIIFVYAVQFLYFCAQLGKNTN